MTVETIQDLLDREPFLPFQILTNAGKRYEVTNANMVHMMKSDIFYFFPEADRFAMIPLRNVAAIEVDQRAA
jgi:hypothetical protein